MDKQKQIIRLLEAYLEGRISKTTVYRIAKMLSLPVFHPGKARA